MVFVYGCCCALAAVLVVMCIRALTVSRAAASVKLDPAVLERYAGVEQKLAELVRIPTVSCFDPRDENNAAFTAFVERLAVLYPLVHGRFMRIDAGDRAIVFEWPGTQPELLPVIFTAHFDVVAPGDETQWTYPPFSGTICGGYIHGRGTQDVKIMLCAALEAAEKLLASGFIPKRSVFFAFGGDEETGGARGAAAIAAALFARNIRASFLMDEGGFVSDGILNFADRPLALIGVAEKGYVDVQLWASGEGGHASMPPRHTAAGRIAKAVTMSEARRFPPRITKTVAAFLNELCPYVPFAYRFLFKNLFVTKRLVQYAFSASAETNALIRTTSAATMLSGSTQENVLPNKAAAILNVRVLPGSDVSDVMTRLGSIVAKAGVHAELAHTGCAVDPLPEAPIDHEGYACIKKAVAKVFPEAGTVPFMFTAGTDTKHYAAIAEAMYRFQPVMQKKDDLSGVHGTNEKLSIENARRCTMFYVTILAEC